ncbi:MAG TPA: hypothetical protein VKB19_19810 [Pedobacter sp.]|nr:hypothetical protein [Pedobacter sp.]
MSLIDTFKRLENLHHHIQKRNTGTREDLARRMGVGVSTVQEYINFMKSALNAPIEYDHLRKTYYYIEEGAFNFSFQSQSQRIIEREFYDYLQKFLFEKHLQLKGKGDHPQI